MNSEKKHSEPELREHVFDGIQEYDQKLPNWWLFTLYLFIAFFIIFWVAQYQLGMLRTDQARLDPEIAALRQQKTAEKESMLNDETLFKMSQNEVMLVAGQQSYSSVCMPCHGPNLGGRDEAPQYIGLSLVDKEWKYGNKPTEIYQLIYEGTPNMAAAAARGEIIMPPQGIILGAEKTAQVVAYVLSKQTKG